MKKILDSYANLKFNYKRQDGTRFHPARSCRDVQLESGDTVKSGECFFKPFEGERAIARKVSFPHLSRLLPNSQEDYITHRKTDVIDSCVCLSFLWTPNCKYWKYCSIIWWENQPTIAPFFMKRTLSSVNLTSENTYHSVCTLQGIIGLTRTRVASAMQSTCTVTSKTRGPVSNLRRKMYVVISSVFLFFLFMIAVNCFQLRHFYTQ